MRLVDADAIERQAYDDVHHHAELEDWEFDVVVNYLARAATIDAVPVVHGRWEEADDGDGVVCSVCREDFCTIYLETERFNYCPNCGARMDGGANDGI